METTLTSLAADLREMRDEQRRLYGQLGKSLVAMHRERQSATQDLRRRVEQIASKNLDVPDHSPSPAKRDHRPVYVTPSPVMPIFRGTNKHPVKYLAELDAYFTRMNVTEEDKLDIVNESLVGDALDWAAIYQISWETFEDFKSDFLNSYWSEEAQDKLRQTITTTRWSRKTGRSMENHFAHYVGLARLLTNPIPEATLINELLKHFPPTIQSLWQLKENKSISGAAEFLRHQEHILTPSASTTIPAILPAPPTSNPNKRFRWDRGDRDNHQAGNERRST